MSLHLDATEEDFTTSIVLHPREISEEQVRRFEGYMAEIFQPFGMDMTDPGTALTTRRYIRALLVTTVKGLQHIHERVFPDWVQVRAIGEGATLGAQAILDAVRQVSSCETILVEGGPRLMSGFFAARCLDELFLTLAPQVAGRDDRIARPGLVAGALFAPEHPVWGTLVGVKRGDSHLFLRYAFEWTTEKEA